MRRQIGESGDVVGSADRAPGALDSAASSFEPPADPPLREALRPSGPARFALRTDHLPDAAVVQVDGELDVLTVPKLAAELNGLIRAGGTDLVLDLRNVQFIDSAGLQILLSTRRRLVRASRTLSVICADGPVSRVIELARLTEALHVTTS